MKAFGSGVQSKLMGAAVKSSLSTGSGDGAKTFLFCIPLQVGPASPYARNVRHWYHVILLIQLVVCGTRFVLLGDFLGGFWMALLCALGWYAWKQDMNITYICLWGLGCLVNGIFDALSIIIPIIFNVLTLQILDIFIRALIPSSELLGAAFAWHLYLDYFNTGGGAKDPFMHGIAGSMPDPMGKIVDEVDPEEYKSIAAGIHKQGEAFQRTVESGNLTKQMQRGGRAMQHGLQQGVDQISEQMKEGERMLPPLSQQEQPQHQSSYPPPMRSQKQAPCC